MLFDLSTVAVLNWSSGRRERMQKFYHMCAWGLPFVSLICTYALDHYRYQWNVSTEEWNAPGANQRELALRPYSQLGVANFLRSSHR